MSDEPVDLPVLTTVGNLEIIVAGALKAFCAAMGIDPDDVPDEAWVAAGQGSAEVLVHMHNSATLANETMRDLASLPTTQDSVTQQRASDEFAKRLRPPV